MAPTTRRASASGREENPTAVEIRYLQQQMAALVGRLDSLQGENEHRGRQLAERDEEVTRLRTSVRESETPAPALSASAQLLADSSSAGSATGASRPVVFKGDKYDGSPKNLSRFLNRIENDFALLSKAGLRD